MQAPLNSVELYAPGHWLQAVAPRHFARLLLWSNQREILPASLRSLRRPNTAAVWPLMLETFQTLPKNCLLEHAHLCSQRKEGSAARTRRPMESRRLGCSWWRCSSFYKIVCLAANIIIVKLLFCLRQVSVFVDPPEFRKPRTRAQ